MKKMTFAAAFAVALLSASFTPASATSNQPGEPCPTTSSLEYKFYKNSARKDSYNFAYANKNKETVTVRFIDQNGKEVLSKRFRDLTATHTFNLASLNNGEYSVEIITGNECKVSTETVSVG